MIVEARITRSDLIQMQFYLLFRIPANFYLFVFLWILVAVVSRFLIDDYAITVYLLTVTLVAICAFIGAIAVGILMQVVFASEKQGFIGPQEFEIRDDAFVEVSKGTTMVTNWGNVSRIFRFKKYLYVMISMYRVHIIPRRAFDSDGQFQDFANRIESLASAS